MITLIVTGTQFERRFDTIRTLEIGDKLTLRHVKDNSYDAEAVAVYAADVQVGWIPREAATAIRGLKTRFAKVSALGTDTKGRWTHLEIKITFKDDSPAAKVIAEYGPVIASVLHHMSPKNPKQAEKIARLPKDEQKFAIEEWNMTQQAHEGGRRKK